MTLIKPPDSRSLTFHIERDVAAFRQKMIRSPFDKKWTPLIEGRAKLHEFEVDRRFIVRKGDPSWFLEAGQFTNAVDACRKVKGLFDELASRYSIRTPSHFVVANGSDGKAAFYILTERVSSLDFKKLKANERARAAGEMKRIFETLIEYYADKVESGEDFLPDLPASEQYVYGSLGNSGRHWHLIDTDPMYTKDQERLFEVLNESFDEDMESVESEFSIDLSNVRRRSFELKEKLAAVLGY